MIKYTPLSYNDRGDVYMFKNKGPLMFINTVNTEIKNTNEQEIFDSRVDKKKKKNEEDIDDSKSFEERKIKNIIDMYNKNKPILCNIITTNGEIIGIPYKMLDNVLYIKLTEKEEKEIILDDILDIIIIRF